MFVRDYVVHMTLIPSDKARHSVQMTVLHCTGNCIRKFDYENAPH